MNLLFAGGGKAGSWQIRGVQIGAALGARVCADPRESDFEWADVAVLVKRSAFAYADMARRHGCVIVWDAVDFWAQPGENHFTEAQARQRLKVALDQVRPDLFIGATQAMAVAGDGVCIPHHFRPGLEPKPVRERVEVVAYEGNATYLGRWFGDLSAACARRGWQFVVNPPDLSEADIVVALRDGQFDGWMCREWKSGVKLSNAVAVGRQVITQESAALREMQTPSWSVPPPLTLDYALNGAAGYDERAHAAFWCTENRSRWSLESVSAEYLKALERVACPA